MTQGQQTATKVARQWAKRAGHDVTWSSAVPMQGASGHYAVSLGTRFENEMTMHVATYGGGEGRVVGEIGEPTLISDHGRIWAA
jgi:hypothetical protein